MGSDMLICDEHYVGAAPSPTVYSGANNVVTCQFGDNDDNPVS